MSSTFASLEGQTSPGQTITFDITPEKVGHIFDTSNSYVDIPLEQGSPFNDTAPIYPTLGTLAGVCSTTLDEATGGAGSDTLKFLPSVGARNICLLREARLETVNQGLLDIVRDVHVLHANLAFFKTTQFDSARSDNQQIFSSGYGDTVPSDGTLKQRGTEFTSFAATPQHARKRLGVTARIQLAELFDIFKLPAWDIRLTGGFRITLVLRNDSVLKYAQPAVTGAYGAKKGDTDNSLLIFSDSTKLPSEDQARLPFWVHQKIVIASTTDDTYKTIPDSATVRSITAIDYMSVGNRIEITLDDAFPVDAEHNITVSPLGTDQTIELTYGHPRITFKHAAAGVMMPPQVEFMQTRTEYFMQNSSTGFHTIHLDPATVGMMVAPYNPSSGNIITTENVGSYRLSIDSLGGARNVETKVHRLDRATRALSNIAQNFQTVMCRLPTTVLYTAAKGGLSEEKYSAAGSRRLKEMPIYFGGTYGGASAKTPAATWFDNIPIVEAVPMGSSQAQLEIYPVMGTGGPLPLSPNIVVFQFKRATVIFMAPQDVDAVPVPPQAAVPMAGDASDDDDDDDSGEPTKSS